MPKRHRSPSIEHEKRERPSPPSGPRSSPLAPLWELDELFLRILGHLGPTDLARAQQVSKRWSQIAVDPQLWKRLYLERYTHPHHHVRRSSGRVSVSRSGGSTPLRPIARLPSRAFPPPSPSPSPAPDHERQEEVEEVRHEGVDWKLMMRLGTNWSKGAALSEARVPLPPSPVSRESDTRALPSVSTAAVSEPPSYAEHRLALFPSFICTSNPASPLVHVYTSPPDDATPPLGIVPPPPGWSSPHRPDTVTAIAADQSVITRDPADPALPARLAIMYASGGFAIVRLRLAAGRLVWSRESVWNSRTRPRRVGYGHVARDDDPVVLASMYHPALVTCTRAFVLCVYSLAGGEPSLLRTLRSDVSFHPAALSVFPPAEGLEGVPKRDASKTGRKGTNSGANKFRAALTYSAPVYPTSWTVAVQELIIDIGAHDVQRTEAYTVGAGCDDSVWPRRIKPLVGVRGRAVGIDSDGRWCVLAGDDAVIYVYALPSVAAPAKTRLGDNRHFDPVEVHAQGQGVITHAQTLLAPSSGVTSVALQAGRCVSGGRDGRVLVWDLDEAERSADDEHTVESDVFVDGEARVGRVAAVEVKRGGRRGAPPPSDQVSDRGEDRPSDEDEEHYLPHPTAVSRVARSLFLATPPATLPPAPAPASASRSDNGERSPAIRQLAFDEDKIVGLVDGPAGDVMRVWSFG